MIDYPYSTVAIARLHDTDTWQNIRPYALPIDALVPTQPNVSIKRLIDLLHGAAYETNDDYAHVVVHFGRFYLHDGHHRYVISMLRNEERLSCRVVTVTGEPVF